MKANESVLMRRRSFSRPSPFIRRESLAVSDGITLICCCAGYGKTAYLSQLADDFPRSACISLGYGSVPDLLREVFPEADIKRDDRPDAVATKAVAALLARDGGLLLVDNADSVDDGADILRQLVEAALSCGARMVFAARRIPSYLLELVMDGRAALLGAGEMRFTADESAALIKALKPDASDAFISRFTSFAGGWCAAIPSLLRTGCEDASEAADNSFLTEYIETMILSTLPADLKKRFMQAAFLQGDEEFYREGLRLSDMRSALCRLSRMGIMERRDGGFTCPAVMRCLLAGLLEQDERNALMEQASDYYIRENRFAEAIRLFEVSGNASAAERVLQLYGGGLLENCEFELIGYCGRIVGGHGRLKDPDALGALAQYYYYNGKYAEMEQAFNRADSMFGKENRYSVLRRLYNGLLRYERKPELYEANVRSALDWLKKDDEPLPFLYRKELDTLELITRQSEGKPVGNKLFVNRFGGLHLSAGDNRAEIQCKTKRSAELIAYMLQHGDKPVGRDELLNAFWHDNMPANAVAMLHNMIYHLRRELSAFGLENIISYKNKYYTLDNSLIALEDNRIIEACAAVESGDNAKLLPFEGLLRSYWGAYLGSIDSPWANEKREYYDRCYINACSALASRFFEEGKYDDAAALYKNAYRLDPYSEQLVSDLLSCYAALGQPGQATRCYEDYAARLDAEFGTRPSKWLRHSYFSCFAEDME